MPATTTTTNIRFIFSVFSFISILRFTLSADLNDCALPCTTDVSGTNCTVSNWPCLCANGPWVDQMNECVVKHCNATEQESAFLTFAQLCAIFDVPLTASPEATFPASLLSAPGNSSVSILTAPGPVSVTSLPSIRSTTAGGTTMDTSATTTPSTGSAASATIASSTSSSRTSAAASATTGSGNAGSPREAKGWFTLAVLVLAGAAVL